MNRIFSDGKDGGWPEFPPRAFARLDHFEPADLSKASEAVFSFDAIDARWLSNGFNQLFPGGNTATVQAKMADFWKVLFGKGTLRGPDLFDEIPVYNIEVTVRRGEGFWDDILVLVEKEDWIEIRLAGFGTFEVDVYGSILADPVSAYLQSILPAPANTSQILTALFNVDHWPDASDAEVDAVLQVPPALETLAMYDVGQGSAIGLLNKAFDVKLFFDVGAGSYGNKHTRPAPLRFCWRGQPSIVLSHWDTDHWAGGSSDKASHGRTWLAPRQLGLGPRHHLFAARILKHHGTLRIWNVPIGAVRTITLSGGQNLSIVKCSGSDRNGSGIAMILDDSSAGRSWMLTGDAGYGEIGLTPRFPVAAVTVPHHGADMTSKGGAPPLASAGYTRLLYSFGSDNKHGKSSISHPTSAAVAQHSAWSHGSWSSAPIATTVAGGDILATACNPPTTSPPHLESAATAFTTAPSVPLPGLPCSTHGFPGHCTLDVIQA